MDVNPYLEVSKLDFNYDDREILKEISFQVEQGSFITIIGPNGSGKSTLLRNISAALIPQKGKVFLQNEDVLQIKPKDLAKKLAVVPQETAIQFPFSVSETVLMGRMPHQGRFQKDSGQDFAIAQRAMELTNTLHLQDRLITDLSGGERQRVIVAQALAQEPQVILLDEPTSHLDLHHQLELLELMKKLSKTNGLTVIAVLHDLNLAAQFSDYVLLLHHTKIFASGKPEEVLTAANIKQVYGIEAVISPNELTGCFNIIPLARVAPDPGLPSNRRIHLICGGGTGSYVMDKLLQYGYQVSCGVLNIGDSDWKKAKRLNLEQVEEAPFTAIGPLTYARNKDLLARADIIIVMPIPFGNGNLGNLQQAREAGLAGKTIILVGGNDLAGRDFTGGKANQVYQDMLKEKAHLVHGQQQLFSLLAELK